MFALSNQDQAEAVGGRYSTLYYYEMRTEANNNSCWFGVVSGSRCGDRHDAIGDLFEIKDASHGYRFAKPEIWTIGFQWFNKIDII